MNALATVLILAAAAQSAAPIDVVRSFHAALSAGDRDTALATLDPAVIIFEQGGAEMTRNEYASKHLKEDVEFSRATTSRTIDQRSDAIGDAAWVLTRSETSGTFQGKPVALSNAETVLLKRTATGWKIVHIHWSSHKK